MTAVSGLLAVATAGDPLADAVVTELDLYGPRARRALGSGLRQGLAGLDERPPEAVAALLGEAESTPSHIDPLLLHRGDTVTLSVPPMWFQLCSVPSALTHSFASPAVARTLAANGDPLSAATRRLAETGVWARQALRPGGLLRGAPGYVATVQLRLLHARTRLAGHDGSPAAAESPMTQADMARTWLGFTLLAYRALAAVGIDITAEEEHRLYQYWSRVAQLLGIDESLHQGVTSHVAARQLYELLGSATPTPDATSRALTAGMIEAQARAMAGVPGAVLDREQVRAVVRRVLREAFGEEEAERLGIPAPATTDLMPLIGRLNRQARYWQTFSPASAGEARRRAIEGPGPELIAAVAATTDVHRAPVSAHRESSLAA
ncbi:oxygenase MpaB family protein [Streptomyces sp. NPDC046909]|uniref:oxygenase MpaB family protein n=1 Tax=Streptomyces sp. NPDC046909 TaxID=3155617 RepID=UPI003407328E